MSENPLNRNIFLPANVRDAGNRLTNFYYADTALRRAYPFWPYAPEPVRIASMMIRGDIRRAWNGVASVVWC